MPSVNLGAGVPQERLDASFDARHSDDMPAESGTVRARLVQLEIHAGAVRKNTDRMLEQIVAARADGVNLLVFPELSLTGCLLGDEWECPAFLRNCESCGAEIVAASTGMTVVFGHVTVDWHRRNEDGRPRKYNALLVAEEGRLLSPAGGAFPHAIKTLQPNYRAFDDDRHFYGTRRLAMENRCRPEDLINPVVTRHAGCLGGMLCEDAWDGDYSQTPGPVLAAKGAKRLIVASSSPFTRGKPARRDRVCASLARRTGLPVLYVNNVGVQDIGKTVYTFDGGTAVYDPQGRVLTGPAAFESGCLTFDLPRGGGAMARGTRPVVDDGGDVAQAVLQGTKWMLQRLGLNRVVVGISGGIDSAVAAAVYRALLPPENLMLVAMPGPFTSETTSKLGRTLAANLGTALLELPIHAGVDLTRAQFAAASTRDHPAMGDAGAWRLDERALENVQARDRGARLLAAVAAVFGGVVSCNANKTEITVGYGTLYGDMIGWLSILGDLWKGDVYTLGRYLNQNVHAREAIPEGIFTVRPSAELSARQAVERGLGDPLVYPYHDRLFRSWVERWERAAPEDILDWKRTGTLEAEIGYEGSVDDLFATPRAFVEDMEHWWRLFRGLAVAKRLQAPPILAVSRRAFGFDLREAQLGTHLTDRYQELRRTLLGD